MIHPPFEKSPALSNIESIRHGFFGRRGGSINGRPSGLDMSETLGTDPETVAKHRRAALTAVGMGTFPLVSLKQVHSNTVLTIDEPLPHGSRPEADALVTNRPYIALGILTADCGPILFSDSEAGVIGAAHAGWRGAASNIAQNTVEAMSELGASPSRIVACLGPTISGEHYEVGPEFSANLLDQHPSAGKFIFVPDHSTKEHFDLPGFICAQLAALGIARIERIEACTYAQPNRYFSHRHFTHHAGETGRQISLIGLA